jgi:hypothetical protein
VDQTGSVVREGLSTKKSEINFCEAVADRFCCTSLETEPRGRLPQIVTQLSFALVDVVSNFAAFKCCERVVGDPPPSYSLPFLQLIYFAA